ncbi:helix-hairpin-helix domain-containing protein [Metabacillus sp. FJAT-53654]|uniref:Helix-hairpin-helix domain-containing protein n=1 Tax=Metabacillus rhizosphaerae TaxID=3117747 RepID=A0ABZ2N032_9BACI
MSIFQKYKKWIIVISILLASIGFYYYFINDSGSSEVLSIQEEKDPLTLLDMEEPATEIKNNEAEGKSVLVIDIKGAINQPGVYELETGARVHQLIDIAGGLKKDADELAINLAAPLEDGMVVYIPKKGEVTDNQFTMPAGQDRSDAKDKININLATSEELQTITGIGPSKAEAIITFRDENGPFTSPEGLLEVSGIGEKSLEKIKEEITIK